MRIVKMLKLKKKMGMVKRVRLIGETGWKQVASRSQWIKLTQWT
jgi:hypothetical protein